MKPLIVTPRGKARITLKTDTDILHYIEGKYFNVIPWGFVKCYTENITVLGIDGSTYPAQEHQIKPSLLFHFKNEIPPKKKKEIINKAYDYGHIPVKLNTFKELDFGILIRAGITTKTLNLFFKDIGLIQEKVLSSREKLKKIEI